MAAARGHMTRLFVIAAVVCALATGVAAHAEPAAAPVKPSAKTEALVKRMFKSMKIEATIDGVVGPMIPVMIEQTARQYPRITPDHKAIVEETTRELLRDFTVRLLDRFVRVYAEVYTDEELEGINTFYESAVGQAFINKLPLMGPKTADIMREMMPGLQAEMLVRLCAKLNCGAKTQAGPKPS